MACVTCHDPALSFSDGVARRRGHDGEPLPRRTPSLWNLAWGLTFFWDGRAQSLEAQASGPIENRREMGGDIAKAAARLAADPAMAARFAAAFPDDPRVTEDHIRAALASFERTLVSPRTRFDRWLEGDEAALEPRSAQGSRSSSARRDASPATRAGASPTRPSTTSAWPAPTADVARS